MYKSEEIANRIRSLVAQQGATIGKMLAECGLGVNTVSKIDNGGDVKTLNFAKMADYLNCSVDYLLGRTEFMNLKPEDISREEMRLIALYRQLNQEAQETLMIQADALVTSGKYKKYGSDSVGTKEA